MGRRDCSTQKREFKTEKREFKIFRLEEENSKQKEENERLLNQISSNSPLASSTVGLKLLDASTIESLDRCEEVGSGGFIRVYKVYKK